MKKLAIALIGLAATSAVQAQEDFLNIRLNPFMIFTQQVNIGLDVRVSEHLTVGPVFTANATQPLFDFGVRVVRHEPSAFQRGWYTAGTLMAKQIEPQLGDATYSWNSDQREFCYTSYNSNDNTETTDCRGADLAYQGALHHGYLWRFDSFNVGLGVDVKVTYEDNRTEPWILNSGLSFTMGWVRKL